MTTWAFYPIFAGTAISVVGLSRIALEAQKAGPSNRPLSELAATEERLLLRFRNILILCDILFAITTFGFLAPRASASLLITIFGILMIGGELLVSLLPANSKTLKVHMPLAFVMAIGMFGLTATFWLKQTGTFSSIEASFTAALCAFAILMLLDKRRWLLYELGYIFASHFSLLVAAIALK